MSFLPDDYEAPKSNNNYFKLQDGENRIRVLSKPIIGWEDWTLEKKPIRFRMDQKPSKSIDPKKPVRHFWSFLIYNILENKIQIMNVTQATIRKAIESLSKDSDWGAPYHYDIKIVKSGEGVDTEYHVNPVPHKPLNQDVIDMFNAIPCNLEALFTNEDPFSKEQIEKGITLLGTENKSISNSEDIKKNKVCINDEQLKHFLEVKGKLTNKDQEDVEYKLQKLGVKEFSEILLETYELIMPSLLGRVPVSV